MRSIAHGSCIVLIFLVGLPASAPAVAQATKGHIEGVVTGEDGDPLSV